MMQEKEWSHAPDDRETEAAMEALCLAYPDFYKAEFGRSIEGRSISFLRIGRGKKCLVYVATHHAMENITAALLLRFAGDIGENADKTLFGISIPYLLETRSFYLVPMLDPDGVHLRLYGTEEGELLYERKQRMNGGSKDFSLWQANARGVDLNHNYDAGFAEYKMLEVKEGIAAGRTRYSGAFPLSEPETAAMAALIESLSPSLVLSLHTQGEQIYAPGAAQHRNMAAMAKSLAGFCGYRYTRPEEELALYGGLCDWVGGVLGIPAFTVECGLGQNPLPISEFAGIYARIRRMLFCAAVL